MDGKWKKTQHFAYFNFYNKAKPTNQRGNIIDEGSIG